jgi:DNA-binding response OmpR family regulator
VLKQDNEIDQEFDGLMRKLITYMMEDPRTISASIDLVFVAKAIERVGDHAKNLAEHHLHRQGHRRPAHAARGSLRLDPAARPSAGAWLEGAELKLGPTEFRLLHFLMTHPERVHSRAQLLDRVWGDHVFIEERTVDVHIKRLREALKPVGCADLVETVRGAGYRLTSSGPAVQASA